jgi:cytochrome c nitrite reductase small subunit
VSFRSETVQRILAFTSAAVIGMLGGLGAFTFGYGDGTAYLGNDPEACANCHVMESSLRSWQASSHHGVATCNDCHLSHSPIGKWITKADNGFFHSLAFTTGDFPDPIRIKPRNRAVTQKACLHCHTTFVNTMLPVTTGGDMLLCMQCHGDAGHAQR